MLLPINILIVLVAFLALLLLEHFFIFRLGQYLSIFGASFTPRIFWLLTAISIALILFTLIIPHIIYTPYLKWVYWIGGFFVGFLFNIFVCFALGALFARFLPLHTVSIGQMSIVVALFLSLWGVWNVYFPGVRTININSSSVPSAWKGKKIVQITDVHLGNVYGKGFLSNIVDQINSLSPEMVVITGDLFDGVEGNLEEAASPLANIKSASGVYFVSGNHDMFLGEVREKELMRFLTKQGVQVLENESVIHDGLELLGVGYLGNAKAQYEPILKAAFAKTESKNYRVFASHIPSTIALADKNGMNLQMYGHTHCGQLFPFCFLVGFVFDGYSHGWYELKNGGAYVSCGVGTWLTPMKTSGRNEIVVYQF